MTPALDRSVLQLVYGVTVSGLGVAAGMFGLTSRVLIAVRHPPV
jgi:hypothetical protein